MDRNILSEKLDRISCEELGVPFDQEAQWSRLASRFKNERVTYQRRWLIAACFFLAVFLAPMRLLREISNLPSMDHQLESVTLPAYKSTEIVTQPTKKVEERSVASTRTEQVLHVVAPLKVTLELAKLDLSEVVLEEIGIKTNKKSQPLFAAEDISIIQASLEKPSVEKGRKLSIRAQWQTYPTSTNVKQQGLKIKLNENN